MKSPSEMNDETKNNNKSSGDNYINDDDDDKGSYCFEEIQRKKQPSHYRVSNGSSIRSSSRTNSSQRRRSDLSIPYSSDDDDYAFEGDENDSYDLNDSAKMCSMMDDLMGKNIDGNSKGYDGWQRSGGSISLATPSPGRNNNNNNNNMIIGDSHTFFENCNDNSQYRMKQMFEDSELFEDTLTRVVTSTPKSNSKLSDQDNNNRANNTPTTVGTADESYLYGRGQTGEQQQEQGQQQQRDREDLGGSATFITQNQYQQQKQKRSTSTSTSTQRRRERDSNGSAVSSSKRRSSSTRSIPSADAASGFDNSNRSPSFNGEDSERLSWMEADWDSQRSLFI
jgi:hypothetical protein